MKLMFAAAAMSMVFAGSAVAQVRHDAPRHDAPRHQVHKPAPKPVAKPVAKPGHYAPPKHWKKSRTQWDRHVQACQRKYRSYDARTDRYTVRPGKTAICRL